MKTILTVVVLSVTVLFVCCDNNKPAYEEAQTNQEGLVKQIERGEYLVQALGCHDCHSPKVMTNKGPEPDPLRLLSGHPSDELLPPFDSATAQGYVLVSMGGTAARGPWGTSFAGNLTPDDTGIGNWTEENFITAMKKGWYKGVENGRPLMPLMPWQGYSKMTDEDIKAIFAYLKTLPPVKNIVPAYAPPVGVQ